MTEKDDHLLAALEACERSVWDALVAGDQGGDATALHDDFLGVYTDGFGTKADHVGQLGDGPTVAQFSLSDLRLRRLGQDHALLSYRADFQRVGRTEPEAMYVSSIWERHGSGWKNIFSQDTPAQE